jgi:hypothetical protein
MKTEAPAILGNTSGFAPHCSLHTHAQVTEALPTNTEGSFVKSYKIHQYFQNQVSESSHLQDILSRNGS